MEMKLSDVANALLTVSDLYQCSLEEAWNRYIHPAITENYSFKDVEEYIVHKVKLGESYLKNERKF